MLLPHRFLRLLLAASLGALPACAMPTAPVGSAVPASGSTLGTVTQEVRQREMAFAQTMADRNPTAFAGFIADEAIFFSGDHAMRGKPAILADWAKFFTSPGVPFSWQPDTVEVLDSGTLALTSGPVRGATGKLTGRFNSIWRRESDGVWRVVFDRGNALCEHATP